MGGGIGWGEAVLGGAVFGGTTVLVEIPARPLGSSENFLIANMFMSAEKQFKSIISKPLKVQ